MAQYSYNQVLNLNTEIPAEVVPESSKKLLASTCKSISITATGANSANAGGFLVFQFPTGAGAGWLKTKSVAFSCTITPTGLANGDTASFPMSEIASSVINRLTLTIGSQQIEQIQNYAQFANLLLQHCGSQSYAEFDAKILEARGQTTNGAQATAGTVPKVFLPLHSGILNADKYIPLWLLGAPLQLQLDFNQLAAAFVSTSAVQAATGYTISDPKLYFDVVQQDSAYDNEIRTVMATGKAFSIYHNSVLSASTAQALGALLSFNSGVSLGSLTGIMHTNILTANLASVTAAKKFTDNGQTQTKFMVDGNQYPQYPINTLNPTEAFYCLQNMIGNVFDPSVTTLADRATYKTDSWCVGVGLRRSNTAGFTHTGIPATQVVTEITGATAATTVFIYYLYSAELLIDASGAVMLIK